MKNIDREIYFFYLKTIDSGTYFLFSCILLWFVIFIELLEFEPNTFTSKRRLLWKIFGEKFFFSSKTIDSTYFYLRALFFFLIFSLHQGVNTSK
jgi:hypothetical protein